MKKLIITAVFSVCCFAAFSQTPNIYGLLYNSVNEDFKFPLIGFINTAKGDHKGLQLGFINTNTGSFAGSQTGFINTTAGGFSGSQIGFINTAVKEANDLQLGFLNTTAGNLSGAQIGFVNTAAKEANGLQLGFVNFVRQKMKGAQIGFVNYADTIGNGIPVGFLSIVKHGGYMALEYGFSEFHPVTVGFKTGVEKLYTTILVAYNPFHESSVSGVALGGGFGSIIPVGQSFFFNPEFNTLHLLNKNNDTQLMSLVPLFGYRLNERFSIAAGPSVTWNFRLDDGDLLKPLFGIVNHKISDGHRLVVGARLGVRYRF